MKEYYSQRICENCEHARIEGGEAAGPDGPGCPPEANCSLVYNPDCTERTGMEWLLDIIEHHEENAAIRCPRFEWRFHECGGCGTQIPLAPGDIPDRLWILDGLSGCVSPMCSQGCVDRINAKIAAELEEFNMARPDDGEWMQYTSEEWT